MCIDYKEIIRKIIIDVLDIHFHIFPVIISRAWGYWCILFSFFHLHKINKFSKMTTFYFQVDVFAYILYTCVHAFHLLGMSFWRALRLDNNSPSIMHKLKCPFLSLPLPNYLASHKYYFSLVTFLSFITFIKILVTNLGTWSLSVWYLTASLNSTFYHSKDHNYCSIFIV